MSEQWSSVKHVVKKTAIKEVNNLSRPIHKSEGHASKTGNRKCRCQRERRIGKRGESPSNEEKKLIA